MFMSEIFLQEGFVKLTRDILLPMTRLISKAKMQVPFHLLCLLAKKHTVRKPCFLFFDGLIPEGWLLDVVSRNWKINNRDRFGLLLVACKDCIGNVTIMEEKL